MLIVSADLRIGFNPLNRNRKETLPEKLKKNTFTANW